MRCDAVNSKAACSTADSYKRYPALTLFWILVTATTSLLNGCHSARCAPDRLVVDAELQKRMHAGLGPSKFGAECTFPADVDVSDGLTSDEAVAVALWNNAAFNATLAQLGMVRGDLVQAGLLRNPQFQLFLPGGSKQLEYTLYLPIDAILLREQRLNMSQREVCRVAQQLVQNGLDLVRDVRVAHADLVFARERSALAHDAVDLRQRVSDLTTKRLDAGDISELEAITARIDLLQANADAAGLSQAIPQAEARLKQLMSIAMLQVPVVPVADSDLSVPDDDVQSLKADATNSRPDLKAAAFAYEAAQHRAGLSRWQWFRLDLVGDGNSGGSGATNFGPGFRFDVPFFDRNQGGIMRADWSVYEASQNYFMVRDQVMMEVETAYSQAHQAKDNLDVLQRDVLVALDEAVVLAEKAYQDGGTSYFLVLQTTSQFLDARARELQLQADLSRALANLDRSVGHHLSASPHLQVEMQPEITQHSATLPATDP